MLIRQIPDTPESPLLPSASTPAAPEAVVDGGVLAVDHDAQAVASPLMAAVATVNDVAAEVVAQGDPSVLIADPAALTQLHIQAYVNTRGFDVNVYATQLLFKDAVFISAGESLHVETQELARLYVQQSRVPILDGK